MQCSWFCTFLCFKRKLFVKVQVNFMHTVSPICGQLWWWNSDHIRHHCGTWSAFCFSSNKWESICHGICHSCSKCKFHCSWNNQCHRYKDFLVLSDCVAHHFEKETFHLVQIQVSFSQQPRLLILVDVHSWVERCSFPILRAWKFFKLLALKENFKGLHSRMRHAPHPMSYSTTSMSLFIIHIN